jgi:hypothetical protein
MGYAVLVWGYNGKELLGTLFVVAVSLMCENLVLATYSPTGLCLFISRLVPRLLAMVAKMLNLHGGLHLLLLFLCCVETSFS